MRECAEQLGLQTPAALAGREQGIGAGDPDDHEVGCGSGRVVLRAQVSGGDSQAKVRATAVRAQHVGDGEGDDAVAEQARRPAERHRAFARLGGDRGGTTTTGHRPERLGTRRPGQFRGGRQGGEALAPPLGVGVASVRAHRGDAEEGVAQLVVGGSGAEILAAVEGGAIAQQPVDRRSVEAERVDRDDESGAVLRLGHEGDVRDAPRPVRLGAQALAQRGELVGQRDLREDGELDGLLGMRKDPLHAGRRVGVEPQDGVTGDQLAQGSREARGGQCGTEVLPDIPHRRAPEGQRCVEGGEVRGLEGGERKRLLHTCAHTPRVPANST